MTDLVIIILCIIGLCGGLTVRGLAIGALICTCISIFCKALIKGLKND